MSSASEGGDSQVLEPTDAFSVLGNETRMTILRILGEADNELSFSELRDRVGVSDSGQFNYHLGKLTGHFVNRSEEGYSLRQPGQRIIKAVLSGAVTHDPRISPTQIDDDCYHCGTPVYMDYQDEAVGLYCPGCEGNFGSAEELLNKRWVDGEYPEEMGFLGFNPLPPAGVRGRTPFEVHQAAAAWIERAGFALWANNCPDCSAPLDHEVDVCENHHSTSNDPCEKCGSRQAVIIEFTCTNCIHGARTIVSAPIKGAAPLLDFVTDHGLDPTNPSSPMHYWKHFMPYEEEVISTDPFEARFTFTMEGDSITLAVNEELETIRTERAD